jgi:hypothetical protein
MKSVASAAMATMTAATMTTAMAHLSHEAAGC